MAESTNQSLAEASKLPINILVLLLPILVKLKTKAKKKPINAV